MPIDYESNEIHLNLDNVPGIQETNRTSAVVRPGNIVKKDSNGYFTPAAYADLDKMPLYVVKRVSAGGRATNADIPSGDSIDVVRLENGLECSVKGVMTGTQGNGVEVTLSSTAGSIGAATTSNGSNRVIALVSRGVTGAESGDRIAVTFLNENYTKS